MALTDPVTGAFGVMWDTWVGVLSFLSKGEITVGSAVMVSLVMLIVGILVYTMLKSVVFTALQSKISEIGGGMGGEAISNWVPFLIAISIDMLMVYTGVILLFIPFLWILFIAMLIGIGWMLWSGAKATISTGMDLSSQFPLRAKAKSWWNAGKISSGEAELGREEAEFGLEQQGQNLTLQQIQNEQTLSEEEGRIENVLQQEFAQEAQAYRNLNEWLSSPMYANQLIGIGGIDTRNHILGTLAKWRTKYKVQSDEEKKLVVDINETVKIWNSISAKLKSIVAHKNPNPETKVLQAQIDARLVRANLDVQKVQRIISTMKTRVAALSAAANSKWQWYEYMMKLLSKRNFNEQDLNGTNGVRHSILEMLRLIDVQEKDIMMLRQAHTEINALIADLRNMVMGARVGTAKARSVIKTKKVAARTQAARARAGKPVARKPMQRAPAAGPRGRRRGP